MPPDTLQIPEVYEMPANLPDSMWERIIQSTPEQARHLLDSLKLSMTVDEPVYKKNLLLPVWAIFLIVVIILGVFYLVYVYFPALYEKKQNKRKDEEASMQLMVKRSTYDRWFTECNPYYAALPAQLKEVFLHRTLRFMKEKEFRFHQLAYDEFAIAMISGAAVQLTLGLKNYMLDYFQVIHIIRKEYVREEDNELYLGHVSKSGIYFSWEHFVKGYENYSDSFNLGLHEMAHAVSFDVFLGQTDNHDFAFRSRLEGFMEEGRPVFRSMRLRDNPVLAENGAINIDEFWAVCVETFFENPLAFSRELPDLYLAIVDLLNQDPLKHPIIQNSQLAGYEC